MIWKNCLVKPALYAESDGNIWTDEHISKGMLAAHLNPAWDAASRKITFIEQSAAWIGALVPPHRFRKLLDLGCGPGLYAERFCKLGYEVTGIDFSERSIRYAKEQAQNSHSDITYCVKNYLDMAYTEQFDVVSMIYCDYAVLSKSDRMQLLTLVYRALKPGGRFLFDVFTERQREKETTSWYFSEKSDFWCAAPHLCLEAVYQYDDADHTELQQTIVCTEESVRRFHTWNHYFTKESLLDETGAVFSNCELYGDVAGRPYQEDSETICCVLTK